MTRRHTAYTGRASSVLRTIVMRIWRSSSQDTGASTPSRNWSSEKPTAATVVATAPIATGASACAGSRSSRTRPAPYPTAVKTSEFTPSV
jgi:hypothetical protein